MTEYFGININRTKNLPVQVYNEKKDELEIIHMVQNGDTIYVSMELFKALAKELSLDYGYYTDNQARKRIEELFKHKPLNCSDRRGLND